MKLRDASEMLLLAALWGGSFIFLRLSVSEFGPVAIAQIRVAGAAACLLPLVMLRGDVGYVRREWKHMVVCGILSYGLPFALVAYSMLSMTGGLSSIFNASTPLWGAVVARIWLGDRLSPSRILGLAIGFAGVTWLAFTRTGLPDTAERHEQWLGIAAMLGATLCYALGVSYTKRYLSDVPPLAVAAGSQLGGVALLALPAIALWPTSPPSPQAWFAVAMLALASTAFAYVLFYRLISNVGPANALATTFLVPAFAVLWGWLVFRESLTLTMVAGCIVIFIGTVLAVGLYKFGPQAKLAN